MHRRSALLWEGVRLVLRSYASARNSSDTCEQKTGPSRRRTASLPCSYGPVRLRSARGTAHNLSAAGGRMPPRSLNSSL